MKREPDDTDFYLDSVNYTRRLEKALAAKLGLPDLKAGVQIIRDQNGWRENEKAIAYVWLVNISRSFVGEGGIFVIQFNEHNFRQYSNPGELMQGIFTCRQTEINELYTQTTNDATDEIAEAFDLSLFNANRGITLDGVSYNVGIISSNINTFIKVDNPNTDQWRSWQTELRTLGEELAQRARNSELLELFSNW